jgi:two-component system cell cycle sensor histidine kinase/response regulator CckA
MASACATRLSAERERAEARKRETSEQLIRAERMSSLGMLAEGAAHDLSNILGPVLQYPALIREALPPDSPALKLVQAIEEAGQKSAAVLQDLQTIGRGGQYEKSSVNVNHVVDRFMRSHDFERLKQHYAKVRAELQMAAALPTIVGSELQLQQLLSNLVAHAFEAMPGGGMLTIETGSGRLERPVGRYGSGAPGEYVVLKVSDTGSGLAPEDVERIFEPFYVRSVMGRHMLSGLSMTLVYRVVADHHGFIDVTTAAGKGTTFVVYLPVAAADGTLELKPDYTGRETVLVVDDYEEHRDAATELLRDLGYRALTARNGREALTVLEASLRGETDRIDLVVLDLVLGDDFDGVETYKKIIELQPGQKTVMVSGFADIARIVEARKLGLRQCIQKPYTLDGLGKAVRSELDAG